ncbi:MAG: hypothetical protein QM817_21410 [Archangium sp.]
MQGPQGPQGPAGASSITSSAVDAGSRDCEYGGSRFTIGTNSAYACNGVPGPQGPIGNPGINGAGFARTYVVTATGTSTQNGTLLRNTIQNITSPTAASPARVIVEPGVYDIGTTSLLMRRFVDVEGGGAHNTRIVGTMTGSSTNLGIVSLADDMVLRGVTIENLNSNASINCTAVGMVSGSTLLRLRDSVITLTQPCQVTFATYFSMASVEFDGVTINATGGVLGNQGFRVQAGTGTFRNGTIRAALALTDPIGNTSSFRVANSLVQGTPSGARACVGVFNDQFAPLSATCD